jgi:hypothetical protein
MAHAGSAWPAFQASRRRHLAGVSTGLTPAEKVAENILCELFTTVLDWTVEQVRLQESRVDMMLTRNGLKYVIVEAKRPGSFDGRGSVMRALRQAQGYAIDLGVDTIAVSDGCILEAYDRTATGLRPRAVLHLADEQPAADLWWLSTRGIYRQPAVAPAISAADLADDCVMHPKYKLPARCFAYVGDPARPTTWKLPYLLADGEVDAKRLPKAIGAVIRDYRGEQLKGLPAEHVGDVLTRLADAAARTGRMPHQDATPAQIYVALRESIAQLNLDGR